MEKTKEAQNNDKNEKKEVNAEKKKIIKKINKKLIAIKII